ncbi:hypothetical protein PVAND_004328 [Polypedilum vanderplanki]|uniref:C-type lectin domain-containing protein n=1 Tax=Polypedilum vanderplanki TaxID=319348 RepID=A0A9J6BWM9_POLVA|nr:hypothetical protein PVAND_004328 [Polypedilum vanderplanki]
MKSFIIFLLGFSINNSTVFSLSERMKIPVNVSNEICHKELKIFDTKGKLIKIACYVNIEADYKNASNLCSKNNMKLYKFNSVDSYNGWLQFANSIWTPNFGAAVWVNGERLRFCSGKFRIVEDSQKTKIQGDILYADHYYCGNCMVMQNSYGDFHASPGNCNDKMHFFCEIVG